MSDALCEHVLPAFRLAGETLAACGCNNSHSGNLSQRVDDRVIITRTGAMLGRLAVDDLVVTSSAPTNDERLQASSELVVHLAIYERTKCGAVAHGHALWAVLAAWFADELKPIDVEGAYYHGSIPVVECTPATASPILGTALATSLTLKPVAIVRGHGVFAVGDNLERAMQHICSVNDSARLLVEAHKLGLNVNELAEKDYLKFD
jgi:L-fuculose-phosphate aldolase